MIRICAFGAILSGVLRSITAFIPETTPRILLIYLVIDLCLLLGVIAIYRFTAPSVKLIRLLGTILMTLALVVLIGRDLGIVSSSIYAAGAATFSVGLDLLAIHLLQTRKMPVGIPVSWLLSTMIGSAGFFVSQLHFLFTFSGLILGIAFAAAGVVVWVRASPELRTTMSAI